jgi:hypothetical protein
MNKLLCQHEVKYMNNQAYPISNRKMVYVGNADYRIEFKPLRIYRIPQNFKNYIHKPNNKNYFGLSWKYE